MHPAQGVKGNKDGADRYLFGRGVASALFMLEVLRQSLLTGCFRGPAMVLPIV